MEISDQSYKSVSNFQVQASFELFRVGLTTAAWIVIIYFINLGLKQIDDAKKLEKEQVKR